MRLPLLLAIGLITAMGSEAQSQTPPALPTVEKPKSRIPATPVPVPDAEPAIDPDPNAKPAGEPPDDTALLDPRGGGRTKTGRKGRTASGEADSGEAASGSTETNPGPEYTGPAILSRGINFVRPSLPETERFRPFAGLNFVHDSGVSGQYEGVGSTVSNRSGNSLDVNYGISGQHVRKKDIFQLDYRGHSFLGSSTASQDQALSLSYARVLSRRFTATLAESAGLYSSSFSVLNSFSQTDTSVSNTTLVTSPNTEPFDDRTYYSTTSTDVTYQRSSRLSIDFGGNAFFVRRNSRSLIGVGGYQARTDIAYRFSKRSTIGPYYAYSRYNYSGTFGDTGVHTAGLNYSMALNKNTQFGLRFGGTRLESRGLLTVGLDPAIAAILGTNTGIQRFYTVTTLTDIAANLSRSFRHSSVSLSYARGVSPGNGIVLTSQHESDTITYTYNGLRQYGMTVSGGRDKLSSQVQNIGTFDSYSARTAISHPLPHNVQAIFSFDYRRLGFTTGQYAKGQYRLSIGFAFAPGLSPLKFW